jgi:hypothetical protein
VATIVALFHAGTGFLLEVVAAALRTSEMALLGNVHAALKPGDVLVADRGFCSFAHLALLACRDVHAVFRVHHRQIVDFTPDRPHIHPRTSAAGKGLPRSRWMRSLGLLDQLVEWFKPLQKPPWITQDQFDALPDSLLIREIRYRVGRPGFRTETVTLVTTLLDAELYTVETLADLYAARWRVELNLRHLKQTMKMDVLKCRTVEGVLKELTVYAIVYNLVRITMREAALRQDVDVERISFIDAVRWLCELKADELLELVINPARSGRFEPRVRKRRSKKYPVMKKPRSELRKRLMGQRVAA